MEMTKAILKAAEEFIVDHYANNVDASVYVYHNLDHTQDVVNGVKTIGKASDLTEQELFLLEAAAWFHDAGHDQGRNNHEERSAQLATAYFSEQGLDQDNIEIIKRLILATKMTTIPTDVLEEIICDADLSHLGLEIYRKRCLLVREEIKLTEGKTFSQQEWYDYELQFLDWHRYYTPAAEQHYAQGKSLNISYLQNLQREYLQTRPEAIVDAIQQAHKPKKKKKKKKKKNNDRLWNDKVPNRGIETMFRSIYRVHINLSAIADNKANIMLSINAIIISITLPMLIPSFGEYEAWRIVIPTTMLMATCLGAMIYATLSTRPKITSGRVTRESILDKQANLLFFGNFYDMPLDEYQWGIGQMMSSSEYLYGSMAKDIYFLGKVLAKKYTYLRHCYTIFMFGLIASVLAFGICFSI